jgi:3-oxoadipate enol-lactonase
MPLARINGIELYYEVHGEGPALVLAHGGGGSHLSWWQNVPELARRFRCVTFDHRGFGASRDLADGPGPKAFVEDLRQLLDHLGIERAALAGQSMGGWTVLGFAVAYPSRVSALTLCDTTAGMDDADIIREQANLREMSKGGLANIRVPMLPTFRRAIRSAVFSISRFPDSTRTCLRTCSPSS